MDNKTAHFQMLMAGLKDFQDPENSILILLKNGSYKISKTLLILSGGVMVQNILKDMDSEVSVIMMPDVDYWTCRSFIDLICHGYSNCQSRKMKQKLQDLAFNLFDLETAHFSVILNDDDSEVDSDDEDIVIENFEHLANEQQDMCIFCGKLFYSKYTRARHEKTCDKNMNKADGYKCTVCQKILKTERGLRSHEKQHIYLSVGPYKCDLCPKTFKHSKDLRRHSKAHDKKQKTKFSCDNCEFKTTRHDNLLRHQKTIHNIVNLDIKTLHKELSDEITYQCPQCSRKFRKSDAIRHLKLERCNDHICVHCEKTFTQKSNLNQHLRTVHSNI